MYSRIQRKLQNILYTVDLFEYEGNILRLKGWIFSENEKVEDIAIILTSKGEKWDLIAETEVERIDVYNHHNRNLHAKNSGFYTASLIKGITNGMVWLEYTKNEKKYKLFIGSIKGERNEEVVVRPYAEAMEYLNLQSFEKIALSDFKYPEIKDVTIDVIIPVYNGFQYLEPLLSSIKKTDMQYRLILIEDCSPDERVRPYLREYQQNHSEVILIENEKNLGFVKSVNKGLKYSCNHVALVNTDVEVPELWLERLMLPILEDDTIASTTPYTNAGTICSFPNLGEDNNEIFQELDLETIDNEFKKIKPRYTEMPTGVGFCMGMNKKAIKEVGLLDEENFGMGYGEENDWCQRAIIHKMKNVHVENLFVYHKHGGSFLSEDKKKLSEEHKKILSCKYPKYNYEVAYYFEMDINKDIRKYVEWKLLLSRKVSTTLAFNHSLGGGATSYLKNRETEILSCGGVFCLIRCNYDIGRTEVIYKCQKSVIKFRIHKLSEMMEMVRRISPDYIVINEIVSYLRLYEILQYLIDYKQQHKVELTLLGHDFYMVCPTVNLLNDKEQYCGIPDLKKCEECVKNNNELKYLEFNSVKEWRSKWKKFMDICDHIIVFSNDSKEIFEKAYGTLSNLQVIPHKIDYLPAIPKKYKHTKSLNIGLMGALVKHKGLDFVKKTLKYIENNNLNVNLILVGTCAENIRSRHFVETGEYTRDMLPSLLFQYDIDVFWIASIWPETFSYTTEEIMTMGFPIMSFDLGAPAERIKKYEKGAIIPSMRLEDVIATAEQLYQNESYVYISKKILFVVEDITFSSRYRVDHLREQLLYRGVTSDCFSIREALTSNLKQYESILIYRNSMPKQVKKLVSMAHRLSKKVFYDTDDLIFDYESIADLDFLSNEYKDFKRYSDNVRDAMKQCDAYITSTNTLAYQIAKCMNSDEVYVNRNVASAEMAILSVTEKNHSKKDPEKIILGYFSGTKTHDRDFALIKDVLLDIMEKYDNVWLRVGGQIKTSKEFTPYFDRIETFEFVSWKKLPHLIAGVDINLMPLESTIFHKSKSENKWQEAAMVGVPTIGSYNEELSLAITDNQDGFLCRNTDEWRKKLEILITNEEVRNSIAEAAFEKVMKEYTTYTRDVSEIKNVLCGEKK